MNPADHPYRAQPGNVDEATVQGFGAEWTRFDFVGRSSEELDAVFADYFSLFPWAALPPDAEGFDAGCGTGRWAMRVAPRVGRLHCVDASAEALEVARQNVAPFPNCELHHASIDALPFPGASQDFGYSLGVLHHMPDTAAGLAACASKLKPGAPFLLYLYYSLDNRSRSYRALWQASNALRRIISGLPSRARFVVSEAIAAAVYWPLARAARTVEALGGDVAHLPLSYYRNLSFYVMRNDALDRFGTPLEHRFSQAEIRSMMQAAGLESITFRSGPPYWCAIGYRKRQ